MSDRGWTVNSLNKALTDYIGTRRNLGFRLRISAGLLKNFVAFLQTEGASHITTELALRWATQPANAQPATWAWRLGMVRRFATWHRATDTHTEIPPAGILSHRYRRKTPTSIPTPRSKGSLPKRDSSTPPRDCAPGGLPLLSVYWP